MKQPIAIFGSGELGLALAESLRDLDRHLTLYDYHQARVAAAQAKGFNAKVLDFQSDEQLKQAGVGDSLALLFAIFEEDSENVFLCLSARALAPDLRIMSIAHQPDAKHRLIAAGANKVIDPHHLSARRIFQIMTRPIAAEVLEHTIFGRQDLELAEVPIKAALAQRCKRVGELEFQQFDLILVGYLGQNEIIEPELGYIAPEHPLEQGDVLLVVGRNEAIETFRNYIRNI